MGRPREHDQRTAAALLDAAERTAELEGLEMLSLRHVAVEAGTTTRAVYSLFGSKQGLIVALGTRAFEILGGNIRALPSTDDPASDLVQAGVTVFRRFVIEHPSLFRIGIQRTATSSQQTTQFQPAAAQALDGLKARVARLRDAGGLTTTTVPNATLEFHALCEGLAAVDLRGLLPDGHEDQIWQEALTALIAGFNHTTSPVTSHPDRNTEDDL